MSKRDSCDSFLMLRQYKLDLIARFMEIKSVSPRLGQSETAKEISYSSITIQQHRNNINMFLSIESHQIILTKENKRFQIENMTSKELKWCQRNPLQILNWLNLRKKNGKLVEKLNFTWNIWTKIFRIITFTRN